MSNEGTRREEEHESVCIAYLDNVAILCDAMKRELCHGFPWLRLRFKVLYTRISDITRTFVFGRPCKLESVQRPVDPGKPPNPGLEQRPWTW